MIRVNNCVYEIVLTPLVPAPCIHAPRPLTCQTSVPGVFPNDIQGSRRGVPYVITKGPPERDSRGPSHHVGLGVPHAPAIVFSAARELRPSCSAPAGAVLTGSGLALPGLGVPGASREPAPRPPDAGTAAGTAAPGSADCRRLLACRQAHAELFYINV